MNTLTRLDSFVFSLFVPPLPKSNLPPSSPSRITEKTTEFPEATAGSLHRLSNLPPTPRKNRKIRRTKPTTATIKLPPPSTPLLLRILLALWSILLSFWRSLVGETRAERVRRRKRAPHSIRLGQGVVSVSEAEGDGEGDGSASEIEGGIVSDDDNWVDPVTRAPVDEKVEEPEEGEFADSARADANFSFRLRSAEKKDMTLQSDLDSKSSRPQPFKRQPTPPSILSNPIQSSDASTKRRQNRLLANPMPTTLLDPSVPSVPASQTMTIASSASSLPPPRPHPTPFHLQKTLILDLDETLIHSTSRPLSYAASAGGGMLGLSFGGILPGRGKRREGHTVEVVLGGRSTTYHVYKRPYVDYFLKKVASWYTLVIYTASMPEYADPVIDWLDAGRGFFAKRLYRESCFLQPNGSYIKDLALVEKDLSRVCFMDNSPISYSWNKANALPIEGWTSDPYDEALLHSIPVLDSLRFVNDVRRVLGIRGFS